MKTIRFKLIPLLSLLLLTFTSLAQPSTPDGFGLNEYTIESEDLGEIHYYVTKNKQDSIKPLLVYIDGSGAYPLFQSYEDGTIGSSVVLNFNQLSEDYHVVLISKPGVPFMDVLEFDEELGMPIYEPPAEYNERLSLGWRVNSADAVINDCIKNLKVYKKKVAIIGISEGYQVGASLLEKNTSITHSILMVGNGLNQFYDFIIENRIDAETGRISQKKAQENIDSLHVVFEDIYKHSESTDLFWYGHTYLRWSSFCSVNPVDPILAANIPIYLVSCSEDKNTTALSADFVTLEAIRMKKSNIKSKVYPYDHSFRETILDENGVVIDKVDHMQEVIATAFDWLKDS